jgi:hypothetical protein
LKKIIVPGLLLFIFCVLPAGAANVSFLVLESGQGITSNQYSTLWENAVYEVFFDAGHIVSNALKIQIPQRPDDNMPSEAARDYSDARQTGMDFFVVVIINYPERKGTGPARPESVTLRLFSTRSEQMIYEQFYTDISASRNPKDEYDSIKRAVRELLEHLNDNETVLFRR